MAIRINKVTLTLKKPAYTGMCALELIKVIYANSIIIALKKYGKNSRLLLTDADSLMYEIKLNISIKILAMIKKFLILVIIRLI